MSNLGTSLQTDLWGSVRLSDWWLNKCPDGLGACSHIIPEIHPAVEDHFHVSINHPFF